ncbi:alpha/beta hydrolase [Aquimarina sp. 2201CG1-2-11]|uniref:alpha/beta fold hydrolase n=1 Tax=Aquimarina discodermiae TaxID=3231043 RepID=UPI0034627FA6
MQNRIFNILRIVYILLMLFSISSCSSDDDLGNLSDTIFVRHKNADMPAYIHGNGSEKIFLITLHGGPGGLGLGFKGKAFDRIEKTCAVVYFDQRGSGMSQGSYSEEELTIDLIAEDVLALVKVLKAKYGSDARFFLLGHSYGGTVGTATLLKNQDDFLGWIEIGSSNNPYGVYFANLTNHALVANEQIALGNSIDYWKSVNHLVLGMDTTTRNDDDSRKLNIEAFKAENRLASDGIINRANNLSDITFEYNLLTAYWNTNTIQSIERRFFGDINYTNRLSEITIPTLLLWGKYDMVVPVTFGTSIFENIGSNSKNLVIFERSGHSPIASEPDQFAEEVIQFMNQNK